MVKKLVLLYTLIVVFSCCAKDSPHTDEAGSTVYDGGGSDSGDAGFDAEKSGGVWGGR